MPLAQGRGRQIANRQLVSEKTTTLIYNEASGEAGTPQSSLSIIMGEGCGAGQAGYCGSDGLGYLADNTSLDTAAEFIFLQDGVTGDVISIIQDGEVYYSRYSYLPGGQFTAGEPVYLSTAGDVTDTEPTTNVWQYLGFATGLDRFIVHIDEPILL